MKFNEDQKYHFELELKQIKPKPDSETINQFIDALEKICVVQKALINKAERKKTKQDRLKALENARDKYKSAAHPESGLISDATHFNDLFNGGSFDTTVRNMTVVETLEKEIEALKEGIGPGRPGRGPADETGFVRRIANLYGQTFQKTPAVTEDGPFWSVVEIARESAGLPHKGLRRAIRRALKS